MTITDTTLTAPLTTSAGPSTARQADLLYHRLMRHSPRSRTWWRPILATLTTAGLYVAFVLPLFVFWFFAEEGAFGESWRPTAELTDASNPMDLLLLLGLIVMMLPAVLLGMRWGGRAPGILHSVRGRVRWGMILRAAAITLPLYAVVLVGLYVLFPPNDVAWPEATSRTLWLYVIIVLLTPLQCAAEEYVFRGLAMQVLGTWLRSPLWGILIPVPLFMLGHGYDWVGQIDIAVFALCMGALVWKSGGLELAIVMHTANNLVLFLLAPFSATSLEQGAVDPMSLLVSLPMTIGVTALLWVWVSRRHGLRVLEPMTNRHGADRASGEARQTT